MKDSQEISALERLLIRRRSIIIVLNHAFLAALANFFAFQIRFEGAVPPLEVGMIVKYLPLLVLIRMGIYLMAGMHRGLWRYASIQELVDIIKSVTFGTVLFIVLVRVIFGESAYPRSVYVLDWILLIFFSGGVRLLMRLYREQLSPAGVGKRVVIVGAGDAGEMIARDIKHNASYKINVIGFIDDDLYKQGLLIHGIPILGTMKDMQKVVDVYRPDEFLICIPSATHKVIQRIYNELSVFNLPVKMLPHMTAILEGALGLSHIKPIAMQDLLQREQVRDDIPSVVDLIRGKSVLITGAGGSIGSELSRQIYKYSPSEMILLDRYENGLYEVELELRALAGGDGPHLHGVIGDILDRRRMESVFKEYSPSVVFHAAAHKHVPLMEINPVEAVKNNVFGTKSILECSASSGVETFIMVSTDKAVNPTNIMGATKRVAEFLVLEANATYSARFSVVRFGNVLGSNGSVFHVFKKQIDRGGPVTVTHPDIKRFFMLIPEAVQLVLQAASYGQGGEIFVLDMGEQIRIVDFAENVIRLSGLVPYKDIDIAFTGLRPGEKLYEELFDQSELKRPTPSGKLMMAEPVRPSGEDLQALLSELKEIAGNDDRGAIAGALRKVVSGFTGHGGADNAQGSGRD